MNRKNGQALIVILVLMVVMVTVTTVSVVLTLVNSQNASQAQLGNEAMAAAESGTENALLLMLRDPYGYSSEQLTLPNNTTVDISVSAGDFPKIITAVGSSGYVSRTLQIVTVYTNNRLTVSSWREVY